MDKGYLKRGIFLFILLAGLTLRLSAIDHKPFHEDEGWTLSHSLYCPFPSLFSSKNYEPMNPPLFYLLEKLTTPFFGVSEFSLRILPCLFSFLSIFFVYRAGVFLKSASAGWIAFALTAFSPLCILYAQVARSFSLFGLWAIVSFFFFLRYLQTRKMSSLFAFWATTFLGFSTHYLFITLFLADSLFFFLFAEKKKRHEVIGWFAFALVLFLIFFQYYLGAFAQWQKETLPAHHIPFPLWIRTLEAFFGLVLGETTYPFNFAVVLPAALFFGLFFLLGLWVCIKERKRWGYLLLLRLFIPLLFWLHLGDDGPRHLSYAVFFFLLIVASGIDRIPVGRLWKITLTFLMILPQTVSAYYWLTGNPNQVINANLLIPWKEIASDLRMKRRPDEWVLLHPDFHHFFVDYYMPEMAPHFLLLPETNYEEKLAPFLKERPDRLWLLTPPNSDRSRKIKLEYFSCYVPLFHKGYVRNPLLTEHFKTGIQKFSFATELFYFQRTPNCKEEKK